MPTGSTVTRIVLLALVSLASVGTVTAQAFGAKFKLRINYQDGAGPYENHHLMGPSLCTDRNNEIYCLWANEAKNPKKDGQFYLTYGALKAVGRDTTGKILISSYEVLDKSYQWVYTGEGPINGTLSFVPGTKQLRSYLPGLGARSWTLCSGGFAGRRSIILSHGQSFFSFPPCAKITLTKVPV